MNKLKIKYPFVYGKFATGTAGLEELRWLLDNVHLIKDEKPKYTVIKASALTEQVK